jgi:gliding motility-associated lipoprotein GldD
VIEKKASFNKKMRFILPAMLLWTMFLTACKSSPDYYPKPKGFPRIDLPEHSYKALGSGFPYNFEYSKHAVVEKDKTADAEPYWILVNYPSLDAKIQFTYKPLNGNLDKLDKHIADAYKLASKHQIKASSQTEQVLSLRNGKMAVLIQLEGEVPSHMQFYVTDTSKHYLRGAVYLKYATLNDSLMPIVDYLKKDCLHLLETLTWKKP